MIRSTLGIACVLAAIIACTRSSNSEQHTRDPVAQSPGAVVPSAPAAPTSAKPASSAPLVAIEPGPPSVIRAGGRRAVKGEHGLVVSVDADATRAGVRVLEAGGNAMDAAIATAYALAVTQPSAGNIGGGGFLLVYRPGGEVSTIDFRETAPSSLTRERFTEMIAKGGVGPLSVGVPGTVAGLELARQRHGTLPRERLLEPAISLARRGHRISHREALTLTWNWRGIRNDPALKATFSDGKKPLASNTLLKRPDLADTLERISKAGNDGFYAGHVAERIEKALGGALTRRDLAAYRAVERKPLEVEYRGHRVYIMPPPSAGGVALALILRQMAAMQAWQHPRTSVPYLHLFLEASRRAQARRRFDVVSPDVLPNEALGPRLLTWTNARELLSRAPIDPSKATPSEAVHPLFPSVVTEAEHTTHLSVVDASGMAVSLTTTLSAGFGAKLAVPGTGIVLNNSAASFASAGENLPEPGRRTTSSMAPTLVLADQKLVAVLGSPGGDTIPSAIAQVFLNLTDGQLALEDAVDAPRLHHGFVPDEYRYERSRPPDPATREALTRLGHRASKKTLSIGDANNIVVVDGIGYGYADPREGGRASAAKKISPEKPR